MGFFSKSKDKSDNIKPVDVAFFESKRVLPVSDTLREISLMQSISRFLLGGLLASLVLSLFLAYQIFAKADILPFVADGGVFGCGVPVINSKD